MQISSWTFLFKIYPYSFFGTKTTIFIYIYIYLERKRKRGRERNKERHGGGTRGVMDIVEGN